jgi:glycosyltransferase involved in cell wall biosynthesis
VTRHLVHVFPAFELGGVQARTATWINALGPGFRHSIISLNGNLDCRDRLAPGLRIDFVAAPAARGGPPGHLLACRRLLRRLRPDVLLTNNWGSIEWVLAARGLPGCRRLHVESGFGSEEADRDYRRRALIRRLVLTGDVRVIVPSRRLRERAVTGWRLDPARLTLVPDGIDCALFAAAADARPPAARPFTVGSVAVLREEKRLDLLLEAFAIVRATVPARLVIAGDGPERKALEARARALGLVADVEFTGFITDVENVYPDLDVFVLSSETEQTPNSVLQAMAAGLPVVSTDVGDVRQMIAPESAPYLTPAGDVAGLAWHILTLARDPSLRRRLAEANRRRAFEAFDLGGMVEAYRALVSA